MCIFFVGRGTILINPVVACVQAWDHAAYGASLAGRIGTFHDHHGRHLLLVGFTLQQVKTLLLLGKFLGVLFLPQLGRHVHYAEDSDVPPWLFR